MNITYNDISRRTRDRNIDRCNGSISPRIYTEHNVFCRENAINAIRNWTMLAEDSNEAFNKALDIFVEVCNNETDSVIHTCCSILCENVDKVRDANQLANSIKHRTSRIKTKISTKINNKYTDVSDLIQNSINQINKTLAAKKVDTTSQNTEENIAAKESFDMLYDVAMMAKECDRITENYSKVSKRFNIDRIVSEVTTTDDIYPAIITICKCMDTYNTPFKNKYSHCLEMSYYALAKHNMNYPSDKIIEAVTDYFVFSSYLDESRIEDIRKVRDISVLFEDADFEVLGYLDDPADDAIFDNDKDGDIDMDDIIGNYCKLGESYTSNNITNLSEAESADPKKEKNPFKAQMKEYKKAGKALKKAFHQGNPDERIDRHTEREIDKFRKECAKDPENKNNITRLKSLVTRVFTKNPEQIVEELPNFFAILRGLIIIGSTAINPIVGIVLLITNYVVKMTLSRKQLEKIVSMYQKEIDNINDKLEKAKDDEDKERYQKYLDELKKDYEKIKLYENDLYSDDENYERDTSTQYNGKDDNSDLDDLFGDDDDWDDLDFEEAASIVYISDLVESIAEGLIDKNVDGVVMGNIYKLDNDSIDTVTDFSITVPTILEKDKLCEALIDYRAKLRESGNITIEDNIRIDCINDNIRRLKENANVYAVSNSLSGICCYLACINEMVNMENNENYIMEMNFSNTLKLAMDRLKKTATKLKDKDKQISNSIDVSINNISKSMEDALMSGNREAVIKGKILPSASKCIKWALALGGIAWVINPVIAIITAIGAFACSQKLKAKERQLILDDIDIELKMCERYIRQAEDQNDLKKVRQLEVIQRNLLRQQQRIRYKMAVIYKEPEIKVPEQD